MLSVFAIFHVVFVCEATHLSYGILQRYSATPCGSHKVSNAQIGPRY